jgi:hypothetical protein
VMFWSSEEDDLEEAIKHSYKIRELDKLLTLGVTGRINVDILTGEHSLTEYKSKSYAVSGSWNGKSYPNYSTYDHLGVEEYNCYSGTWESDSRSNRQNTNTGVIVPPFNQQTLFKGQEFFESDPKGQETWIREQKKSMYKNLFDNQGKLLDDKNKKYILTLGTKYVRQKIEKDKVKLTKPLNIFGDALNTENVAVYLEFITKNFNAEALKELGEVYLPDEDMLSEINPQEIVLLQDIPTNSLTEKDLKNYEKILYSKFQCDSCYGEFNGGVDKYAIKGNVGLAMGKSNTVGFDYGAIICPICNLYAHLNKEVLC